MNIAEKFQRIVDHCKCSVSVNVNDHRDHYESLEKYFDDMPCTPDRDDMKRCLEAGTICDMHAYTETPVGFVYVCEPTFEAAVTAMYRELFGA